MGWDDFSVHQNLELNLSRTLFPSWREYRGFGVMSDSEGTDVIRQGFYLFAAILGIPQDSSPFIYYLLLVFIGCVGCFYLVKSEMLSQDYSKTMMKRWPFLLLLSLVGVVWYIFNLNTLETFYFPVVMYPARFAFYPWLLWAFRKYCKTASSSSAFILVSVSFLSASAYLTATVFFVAVILIFTTILGNLRNPKHFVVGMVLVLLGNAFWLLPFVPYVLTKSSVITQASSYIEINESLLNKPAEDFGWLQLLSYFPATLTTLPFTYLGSTQSYQVHALNEPLERLPMTYIYSLFLPLFFALVGIVLIFAKVIRQKDLSQLWLVGLFIGSLFLLRKEQPPLGFLYDFLGESIPVLKIVLRFGGVKIYPLLLLATILLGLYALSEILRFLFIKQKQILYSFVIFLVISCIVTVSPYVSWFQGHFVSDLVQVDVPAAYEELAQDINQNPEYGRVLHVPMDYYSYWKGYEWGYFGSSFLAFLLEKPLHERTFEPASLENDFFNQSMMRLAMDISQADEPTKKIIAQRAAKILQKSQTKYIIFDGSVSTSISVWGLKAWGTFENAQFQELVSTLETEGYIRKVKNYPIFTQDMARQRGITNQQLEDWKVPVASNLELYELNETFKPVWTVTSALAVDNSLKDGFSDILTDLDTDFIQSPSLASFMSFPFAQPNVDVSFGKGGIHLDVPIKHGGEVTLDTTHDFSQYASESANRVYSVEMQRTGNDLSFSFTEHLLPTQIVTNNTARFTLTYPLEVFENNESVLPVPSSQYLTNWHVNVDEVGPLRIAINNQVLPFFIPKDSIQYYVGSVLVTGDKLEITTLQPSKQQDIATATLKLTDNPNCYGDAKAGYDYSLEYLSDNRAVLKTSRGMVCATMPLLTEIDPQARYLEVVLQPTLSISEPKSDLPVTGTAIQRAITTMMNDARLEGYLDLCIFEPTTQSCLNDVSTVKVPDSFREKIILSTEQIFRYPQLQLLIVMPTQAREQRTLDLINPTVVSYAPVTTEIFQLVEPSSAVATLQVPQKDTITLTIPYVMGTGSYFLNPNVGAWEQASSGQCEAVPEKNIEQGFRRRIASPNWNTLSYVSDCVQNYFLSSRYNPALPYWWAAEYHLFSGRQPQSTIAGKRRLANEHLSKYHEYPALPGMKLFQQADPGPFSSDSWGKEYIESVLKTAQPAVSHRLIAPVATVSGNLLFEEYYGITQLTENQGLLGLDKAVVMPIPPSWAGSRLTVGQPKLEFAKDTIRSVQKIWPSLWRIEVIFSPEPGQSSIILGQAFDDGWILVEAPSPLQALLAPSLKTEPVKVNGWAQGWIFETNAKGATSTLYALYWPEKLWFVGTAITLLTLVTLGVLTIVQIIRKRGLSTPASKRQALFNSIKRKLHSL
jgi:hypothetical protein